MRKLPILAVAAAGVMLLTALPAEAAPRASKAVYDDSVSRAEVIKVGKYISTKELRRCLRNAGYRDPYNIRRSGSYYYAHAYNRRGALVLVKVSARNGSILRADYVKKKKRDRYDDRYDDRYYKDDYYYKDKKKYKKQYKKKQYISLKKVKKRLRKNYDFYNLDYQYRENGYYYFKAHDRRRFPVRIKVDAYNGRVVSVKRFGIFRYW